MKEYRACCAQNKTYTDSYGVPVLYALKYYPELKDIQLEIKEKKVNATTMARFKYSSIVRKPSKRKYVVYINNVKHDVLCYKLSKKFRGDFEWATDMRTIEKGLGWQLYHNGYSIRQLSINSSQAYLCRKAKFYLSPEDILQQIKDKP